MTKVVTNLRIDLFFENLPGRNEHTFQADTNINETYTPENWSSALNTTGVNTLQNKSIRRTFALVSTIILNG